MKRQSWLTWFKKAWDEESWEREIKGIRLVKRMVDGREAGRR
jgi:hypothetical protein